MSDHKRPADGADSTVATLEPVDDGATAIAILRKIHAKQLAPRSLSAHDRQACVELLAADGHSNPEIAEILHVSTRTVVRDRKAIRQANALQADPSLIAEMAGRLVQDAERAVSRLRRLGKEKTTPAATRVEAERAAWKVVCDLTERLQSLGYLPTAAQRLEADLTHHLGQTPSLELALAEMSRLEAIQKDVLGDDPVVEGELTQTRAVLARVSSHTHDAHPEAEEIPDENPPEG